MRHLCRYSLLLSLYLISLAGFSQTSHIDSLKKVLASLPPEGRSFASDTVRVMVLCEMGSERIPNDSAQIILTNAQLYSEQIKWNKGQMISKAYLGRYLCLKGYYFRSSEILFEALEIAELIKDNYYQGYIYRYLAGNYNLIGDTSKSLLYYSKALHFLSKTNDKKIFLTCINNIGLVFFGRKNFNKAIYYFELCKNKNQQYQYKDIEGYCLINLSACYREKKNYAKSINYLSLFKSLKQGTKDDIAFSKAEYAKLHFLNGEIHKAESYAGQAYKLLNDSYRGTQENIHEILYLINERKENYKLSHYHFKQMIDLRAKDAQDTQKRQFEALRIEYENQKQKNDIIILNERDKQKDSEIRLYWIGFALFLISVLFLIWVNRNLSRKNHLIEAQKNEITLIKDKLSKTNAELETLNETLEVRVEERTAELQQANQELIRKNKEIQEAFVNGKTQERKRVASELHDNLGSTIAGLIWQLEGSIPENLSPTEQNIYESLVERMRNAYTEVRHISHNLMPEVLEKEGLIAALEKLISELNRNGKIFFQFKNITSKITFNKKIEVELYSICLELFTNILKHSQAKNAVIKIENYLKGFLLEISDDGIGFSQDKQFQKKGIGLNNLQNRINDFNGNLEIKSIPHQGTTIKIKFNSLEV